jgi:hypothetical protein
MKFTSAALTLLLVASHSASAWTTRSSASTFQRIAAVQLHSAAITTEQTGETATESYCLQFKGEGAASISPWHDIPLKNADGSYNMVRYSVLLLLCSTVYCVQRKSTPRESRGRFILAVALLFCLFPSLFNLIDELTHTHTYTYYMHAQLHHNRLSKSPK